MDACDLNIVEMAWLLGGNSLSLAVVVFGGSIYVYAMSQIADSTC